jgi:hypothetical protein
MFDRGMGIELFLHLNVPGKGSFHDVCKRSTIIAWILHLEHESKVRLESSQGPLEGKLLL